MVIFSKHVQESQSSGSSVMLVAGTTIPGHEPERPHSNEAVDSQDTAESHSTGRAELDEVLGKVEDIGGKEPLDSTSMQEYTQTRGTDVKASAGNEAQIEHIEGGETGW